MTNPPANRLKPSFLKRLKSLVLGGSKPCGTDEEFMAFLHERNRECAEELAMSAIAELYPSVGRDGVPFLEQCCRLLEARYPGWDWCVEPTQFDVPDEEREWAIFVWGPMRVVPSLEMPDLADAFSHRLPVTPEEDAETPDLGDGL